MSDFDWIEDIEPVPYMGQRFIIDKDSIYENIQPYKDSNEHTIVTIISEAEDSTPENVLLNYEGWQSMEGKVNESSVIRLHMLEKLIEAGYMKPLESKPINFIRL